MMPITLMARQKGIPVVMTPQTIVPFTSHRSRALARLSFRNADIVMARDPASARVAAGLGRPADVLSTDMVVAMEHEDTPKTLDVPLNISGLLWSESPHADTLGYPALIRDLIDLLWDDGRGVSLLAHVVGSDDLPGDNDRFAAARLREMFGDNDILLPNSHFAVRHAAGSENVVVGSRMHACLNALAMGTLVVAIAYSRTFDPLMSALGWRHTFNMLESPVRASDVFSDINAAEPLREETLRVRDTADSLVESAASTLRREVMV